MAIILATMSFGPMLAANMLGMLHIDNSTVLQERQLVCQKLATSVSHFLSTKDEVSLQRACRSMVIQVDDLRSVRVVRYDGINLYCSPRSLDVLDIEAGRYRYHRSDASSTEPGWSDMG